MSRAQLTDIDAQRIKDVINDLNEETIKWFNDPARMVNVFGQAKVPVRDGWELLTTEEGLLRQVDGLSSSIGLIFYLTNDKSIRKMAVSLTKPMPEEIAKEDEDKND